RGDVPPRAHVRARGRSSGRCRDRRRADRGGRQEERRRAPDPDDRRHDERRERLGVPLLERAPVAVAVLLHERADAPRAAPRARDPRRRLGRVAADRVRTAARSARSLERGAGVELRRCPGGPGRAEAVHARGAVPSPGGVRSGVSARGAGRARATGAPPPSHRLAKPTGAVCNLDCAYCFFLSKEMLYPGSRFRMADELLETYLRQLIEYHARVPEVTVAWQGGEPTLMGLDFFR